MGVDTMRVIVKCTDDAQEALNLVNEYRLKNKPATMSEVRHMQDPPMTVFKYCVYYLKD